MPLVTKMIRYPNELEAMGFLNNGSSNSMGTVPPSEESIKNCIKDIYDFFIQDLKMVHVPKEGELDINNIPDIGIATYATQNNNLNQHQNVPYGFTDFAFTDELQNTKPIYIRLIYGMLNLTLRNADAMQKNKFAFNLIVYIMDDVGTILHSFISCNTYAHSNFDYTNQQSFVSKYIGSISNGFNNGNSIYVNIIPKKYVACMTSFNTNYYPPDIFSNYICFYIERNENFIKVIQLSGTRTASYSLSYPEQVGTSITYIPYDVNYKYNSSNGVYIPFIDRGIENIKNSMSYTYDLDPKTNILYKNENIMCAYSSDVVDNIIKLENDDTKEYLPYKWAGYNNIRFVGNTKYALLFKVNK